MKNRITEGLAERMNGVCCEVLKGQWERLIREMGPDYAGNKAWPEVYKPLFAYVNGKGLLALTEHRAIGHTIISFDIFLAKLKGNTEAPEPSAPAAAFSKLFNASVNSRQPAYPVNCGDTIFLGLSKKEYFCLAMGVPETGDPELDDIIRNGERKRVAVGIEEGKPALRKK